MLYFDNKKEVVEPLKPLPLLNSAKSAKPWNLQVLRFFLEAAIGILIEIAASAIDLIAPGFGVLASFGLNTINDIIFNYLFNGFEFNWEEFGVSFAFNAINTTARYVKLLHKTKKFNKLASLSDNYNPPLNSWTDGNEIAKAKKFFESTNHLRVEEIPNGENLAKWKLFRKNFVQNGKGMSFWNKRYLKNGLINEKLWKQTSEQSKALYSKVRANTQKFQKTFIKLRMLTSIALSPRYAAKKLTDIAIKKPKSLILKKWDNFYKKYMGKIFKNFNEDHIKENLKDVHINSTWLKSVKFLQGNNPWDSFVTHAILSFNPHTTNKKKPVVLFNKNQKMIWEMIVSNSPGRYYLDNFAWGWDIGKLLSNSSNFITKSTIPLYTTFLTTWMHSFKTVNAIIKTIEKDKWEYANKSVLSEIKEGAKENILKGWNFKGLTPLTSIIRSSVVSNSSFVIKSSQRLYSKTKTYNTHRKFLKNHTYRRKRK